MKPTKLKIFISAIPLVIILILDTIIISGYYIVGAQNQAPKLVLVALQIFKSIPLISFIRSFVNLFFNPDIFQGNANVSIVIINNVLIGLVYFIFIYCIYSIIQYYFRKKQ